MKARLIIADDHQVVRQGLRDIVGRTPDLEIVAEAADGAEAERMARTRAADLLILDIALPVRNGVRVLESLRDDGITLPVLFFSMHPARQYVAFVRRQGAQGYVGKDADSEDLLRAIRRILAGGTGFPRCDGFDAAADVIEAPFSDLSRRETEVMGGLLRGASLIEIADLLGIGAKSVSTYRRRILVKLGVKNNAELAVLAISHSIR